MNAPPTNAGATSSPPMPVGRKPKYIGLALAIIAVLVISAAVALFLNRDRLFPDEHYVTAIKLLKAKDFEGAGTQFRLAIEDRPEDSRAKAMLAYAIVRTKLDATGSSEKPDQLRNDALNTFLTYYAQIALEGTADGASAGGSSSGLVDQIQDTTARKWEKDRIDDAEHAVRDQFKENNIPFTDWVEFKEGAVAAAKEIYALPVDPDDPVDNLAKDISAALLARDADPKAANYLVQRCATDPDLCRLTLVAGDGITKALAASTRDKSSFLAEDGQAALCYLQLKPAILDFLSAHPGLRELHRDDLAADQRDIYEWAFDFSKEWFYRDTGAVAYEPFRKQSYLILLSDIMRERSDFDPLAIKLNVQSVDKSKYVACIAGFDGVVKKYVSRILYWDGKSWQRLKATAKDRAEPVDEFSGSLPDTTFISPQSDDKSSGLPQIGLSTYECRNVTRNQSETRYRSVTSYSQQWRFNPNATYNAYTRQWQGQYMWMNVPSTSQQPYVAVVPHTERVVGTHSSYYKLDAANGHLWYVRDEWTEGSPYQDADFGAM